MKKCPYCAEEIQDEAIVCRYCGRELKPLQSNKIEEDAKLFDDGKILVTTTRAVLMDRTYSLSNITSVKVATKPPSSCLQLIFILVGLVMAGASLDSVVNGFSGDLSDSIIFLIIGIGLTVLGFLMTRGQKDSYIVKIASAGGETDGLVTQDKETAQKVVDALTAAIDKRG